MNRVYNNTVKNKNKQGKKNCVKFFFWVFIDFDDTAQRLYAKHLLQEFPTATWILTGGSIVDAGQFLNQTIYFDQGARITQQFQVGHVPAVVTRENNVLKIKEILIGEDGHEI